MTKKYVSQKPCRCIGKPLDYTMATFTTTLASALANTNGASFVTITTLTEPKMRKTNNPLFGRVLKFAVRNCQFGYDYEKAVNNRLEKEGKERSFSANKLPWGEWAVFNKIIAHKGNLYGRFYVAKNCVVKSAYIVDGRLATAEEVAIIKTFETERTESARQSESGLFENQVKPYDVRLDHILRITSDKMCLTDSKYEELAEVTA